MAYGNVHTESYYTYCSQGCSNYTNGCNVSWSYSNYADASRADRMTSISLTWNQPALKVDSGVKSIADPKEYAAILIELKDKINTLVSDKGKNTVSADSTTATANSTKTNASQYNSLRSTLNTLYTQLKKTSTTVSPVSPFVRATGDSISSLRNQIQSLATDTTGYYLNYLNNSSTSRSVGDGTPPEYINSVTYTDSSSSQRNSATNSGTAYARYVDYNICTEGIKYS